MHWRFAVPTSASASIYRWGYGPSGGGALSSNKKDSYNRMPGDINGIPIIWFGSGDKLSPGISAYVVFDGTLPDFVGFGLASDPWVQPKKFEFFRSHK
jgi:hypothetical protein